jgi:hypothetical protein
VSTKPGWTILQPLKIRKFEQLDNGLLLVPCLTTKCVKSARPSQLPSHKRTIVRR